MRWPPWGRGQEVRALPWVLGVRAPLSIGGSYLPALEPETPFHICIGPGCGLGAVGEGGSIPSVLSFLCWLCTTPPGSAPCPVTPTGLPPGLGQGECREMGALRQWTCVG